MSQTLCILGRQPALGIAELESLYGPERVRPLSTMAAIVDATPQEVDFHRLGGSIRVASIITSFQTTEWLKLEQAVKKLLPDIIHDIPEGKLKFGLSAFGLAVSGAKVNATALSLKKVMRANGRSVRIVPNNDSELNSAQVLHNNLTGTTGIELLLVSDRQHTYLAQTVHIQDIDAYAARDQGRPRRDARVGMLPPKLAQTIINLATGPTATGADADHRQVILDPFCGTGVVLQEALLMGYRVYGSDLEPRMTDYSKSNLAWLQHTILHQPVPQAADNTIRLETGDATTHQWQPTPSIVACEGYLGQPFSSLPSPEKLEQVRSACNIILRKFLQNIARQLPPHSRLCLAVPAWQVAPGQFKHLSTLDQLNDLGYNRWSFEHVGNDDLVYARADQIVARELVVLTKQ